MNCKDKKYKQQLTLQMLTKNIQRSCPTGTCSPQRLREHGFLLPTEALTTILNKHKHTYLPFLHVLPRNCPADRNTSCEINYALNAWYAIARTAGNKSQTQPRQTLPHQRRARKLHHLHVRKLTCQRRAVIAALQAAACDC